MTKSGKHCGKRRKKKIVTMFSKKLSAAEAPESVYTRERVNETKMCQEVVWETN